jgi:uncharacterized protein YndB with AHSA1/START domain
MSPYLEPVRKSVTVALDPGAAFELFTARIGSWWPLGERFSISGLRAKTCAIEGRTGGAVYEVRDDGEKLSWGTVRVWEPPRRLVLVWHPGHAPEAAQEVEVSFAPHADGTRVDLVHRNWQKLGTEAARVRERYEGGWETVFRTAYAAAAAGAVRNG